MVRTLLVSGISSNSKTLTTDEYFQNFCRDILSRHYFVRSAAIADHVGHLMATACRQGLTPLMTKRESSRAATQAAIRAATRNKFKSKIGELSRVQDVDCIINRYALISESFNLGIGHTIKV